MRIGLICDIHEDFKSLKEALRLLERHNCDDLICLGDIVGYDMSCHEPGVMRKPSACLTAIKSECRYAVVGNHDLFAIRKLPQPTDAFRFPSNWYELSLSERQALSNSKVWLYETESTATRLSRSERKYLDGLPESLILTFNSLCIHVSHSVHPDLTGSLMLHLHNPWELRAHLQALKQSNCACGFSGHMHPNGLLIGKEGNIRSAPFGKFDLEAGITQYSCPGIVNGGGRQGYAIVDCASMTIETFRFGEENNKRGTWYERLLKAN